MPADLRRAAVERFRASCERDPDVVAAFLGGSLATGTADVASDIDVYVVVDESGYARFFARRGDFMRSWGRPVFLDETLNFEHLGFDMLHFVLHDGVNGELALGHTGNFRQMHGGFHEVLVDKNGLLAGVTFSLYVPSEAEARQQAERALHWYWLDYLQFGKHMLRGHAVAAHAQLARLRSHCATLVRVVGGDKEGFSVRLEATTEARWASDAWSTARAISDIHRDLGPIVTEHFGVPYPDELASVVRDRIERYRAQAAA